MYVVHKIDVWKCHKIIQYKIEKNFMDGSVMDDIILLFYYFYFISKNFHNKYAWL